VAICYDEARRETVTQSGGKLWAWNGSAWSVRWEEPALDGVDAIAYDQNRKVCWIFGGAGYDDRLWKWDGTSLTLMANDTIGGRAYVAMAFDWKRDRLVVHGGQSAGQWLYSSWGEYDPATNTWQTWGNGPVGNLYAHKMVYDPVRERCVMHGGYYFGNLAAGSYYVYIPGSNFTGAGKLLNMLPQPGQGGTKLGVWHLPAGDSHTNVQVCQKDIEGGLDGGDIAAVAVEEIDPLEAVPAQRAHPVGDGGHEGRGAQRNGAGEGQMVLGHADVEGRGDQQVVPALLGLMGDDLRAHPVGAQQAGGAMLLIGADRYDDGAGTGEKGLDLGRGRRQAGEIERDPTNQGFLGCLFGRLQALFF
jgi:hypothetical protein